MQFNNIDDNILITCFDESLDIIGYVDEFQSLVWNYDFAGMGEFEIILSDASTHSLQMLQNAYYINVDNVPSRIYRTVNDKNIQYVSGVLTSVQKYTRKTGTTITIKGKELKALAQKRIIMTDMSSSTSTAPEMMAAAIRNEITNPADSNRKIDGEVRQECLYTDVVNPPEQYTNLAEALQNMCEQVDGLGWTAAIAERNDTHERGIVWFIYNGQDRSNPVGPTERYQLVDYIDFPSGQNAYIDTGLTHPTGYGAQYEVTGRFGIYRNHLEDNKYYALFGASSMDGSAHYLGTTNTSRWFLRHASKTVTSPAFTWQEPEVFDMRARFAKNTGASWLYLNDASKCYDSAQSGDRATATIYIGCAHDTYYDDGTHYGGGSWRIAELTFTINSESTTLKACYDSENNEYGLYDEASGTFYPNLGAGTIIGPTANGGSVSSAGGGERLNPMLLSFSHDTLDEADYTIPRFSLLNSAIVGGSGSGDSRTIHIAYDDGEKTGLERNEIFVDARNESDDALTGKGLEALADYTDGSVIKLKPSWTYLQRMGYGSYAVGDLGLFTDISVRMRLTKVKLTYELNNISAAFTFGYDKKTIKATFNRIMRSYKNLLNI